MQREFKKVLLDGDVVAYRAAFSTNDFPDPKYALEKVDELVVNIMTACLGGFYAPNEYQVFLTGKGNFRNEVAKTLEYKGNRKDAEKPRYLQSVRDYLVNMYGAVVSEGEEADDLIAIEATKLGYDACIASVDKDFLQVPCWHYNIGKQEFVKVDELEGLRFFYSQILTGDRVDSIQGLKGIGPKKADKILRDCGSEFELYSAVYRTYERVLKEDFEDFMLENAQLLWLRRKKGELFTFESRSLF